MGIFTTHLELEEHILDIVHHLRHSQNVTLRFLISLDTDTIAQLVAFIPNQLEGARGGLAQS